MPALAPEIVRAVEGRYYVGPKCMFVGVGAVPHAEFLKEIRQAIEEIPEGAPERDYQIALQNLCERKDWRYKRNPPKGGQADLYIEDVSPPILIEIKKCGDWRDVGQAAVQLWSYFRDSAMLSPYRVAVFGGKRVQEVHSDLLTQLSIHWVYRDVTSVG